MEWHVWRVPIVLGVMASASLLLFAAAVMASMITRQRSTATKLAAIAVLSQLVVVAVIAIRSTAMTFVAVAALIARAVPLRQVFRSCMAVHAVECRRNNVTSPRLCLLVILAVAALTPGAVAQKQTSNAHDDFYKTVTQLLASPDLVPVREAERLDALPVAESGMGASSTHQVLERPVAIDPKTMLALRSTVLNSDSSLGGPSACLFQPVLALRFHKGRESIQVLVCFICGELVFERKGRPVEWQDKLKFSKETRTRLLAVAKALPEIGDWARVK